VRNRTTCWLLWSGLIVFGIVLGADAQTIHYIRTQKAHHAKMGFDEEFRRILEKHGISAEDFIRPLRGLSRGATGFC
jgi:hypothetical protein